MSDVAKQTKRPYRAPELKEYGTVAGLTGGICPEYPYCDPVLGSI